MHDTTLPPPPHAHTYTLYMPFSHAYACTCTVMQELTADTGLASGTMVPPPNQLPDSDLLGKEFAVQHVS